MIDHLLETLVRIQNLPVVVWLPITTLLPALVAALLVFYAHRYANAWGGDVSFSERRRYLKRIAAFTIAVTAPMAFFFVAKPVPNNAGMKAIDIKFVLDPAASPEEQEKQKKKMLIVLVHGWKGDESTFGLFPNLISTDPALTGFGYTSFHYTVHMKSRNLNVFEIAKVLRGELIRSDVDKNFTQVYIVSHSLGGVIVRQLNVLNKLAKRELPLRGFVSLASPYDGSPFGRIADILGISKTLTRDIGPGSRYLSDLNSYWEFQDRSGLWSYCFGSTIDKIVSAESAITGCKPHYEQVSDFGHTELVKPTAHSDIRYSRVVKTILQDGHF
jgi:hypothetical protein